MPAFLIWAASLREGRGPGHHQAAHHLVLQLDLLGYGKRVVYLDAEIAHRAFQLRVPEKQLHDSQVAPFLIYLCRLGPSHRMRAIGRAIKFSTRDPRMDDPGILPRRQVRRRSDPAGKEVPDVPVSSVGKPRLDRGSGLLGDLELHRTARLLLNDGRVRSRTRPPTRTSSTCSRTRLHPRSLLSIARLNKAR